MRNPELLMKLRELHEELALINEDLKSVDEIDDATVDALGDLVSDVNHIVDQTHESIAEAPEVEANNQMGNHDLHDRIREFETSHPRITRFLSQVTDLLGMMGI